MIAGNECFPNIYIKKVSQCNPKTTVKRNLLCPQCPLEGAKRICVRSTEQSKAEECMRGRQRRRRRKKYPAAPPRLHRQANVPGHN